MTVVGIGAFDNLELAREFVANGGLSTPRMLWAEGVDAWQAFGVASQPAWAVLTPGGEIVDGAFGAIPEERVLELISEI